MIEAALVEFLSGQAAVLALVRKSDGAVALYPEVAPPEISGPTLVYQTVSDVPEPMLSGGASGAAVATVQLSCWGKGYAQAKALADALGGLDGFQGYLNADYWVDVARIEDRRDAGEPAGQGRERGDSCVQLDLTLAYEYDPPALFSEV